MKGLGSWLACGALALGGSATMADIIVVSPDGSGDFPTIQTAINAAEDGDVIELTDGVFTGYGNYLIEYAGKAITVRSQSGDPAACVIDCQEVSTGFSFHDAETSASVLEAVTVIHGLGGIICDENRDRGDNEICYSFGGAVGFSYGASPTLIGCVFSYNGSGYGDVIHSGGGAVCTGESSPDFIRCTFSNNESDRGGAVYISGGTPTFTECEFIGNTSYGQGGAILCVGSASPTFDGCLIQGNSADLGGGAYCNASALFYNCEFIANGASAGGGLYCSDADAPLLDHCVLRSNDAVHGGGVACISPAAFTLEFCTIWSNNATRGGGIYLGGDENVISLPSFDHCTIWGNIATESGSGVYGGPSQPTFAQTIIAFGEGEAFYCDGNLEPVLTCCDVYGNTGGDWSNCIADQSGVDGNISLDPMLCDMAAGNYLINGDSPCAPFSPPNEECDLIGAWPVGCTPTPTRQSSWSEIKASY